MYILQYIYIYMYIYIYTVYIYTILHTYIYIYIAVVFMTVLIVPTWCQVPRPNDLHLRALRSVQAGPGMLLGWKCGQDMQSLYCMICHYIVY